jgi:quinone-modifying oxidoreductase subunit QmoA
MVFLATGIVPQSPGSNIAITCDEFGFITSDPSKRGIYSAGCVKRPTGVSQSVQDATGAALKAIQSIVRR